MTGERKYAVSAGVLLISATFTSLLSAPFLAPLRATDYLAQVDAHRLQVEIGALLACVAALTAPAIAAALYPVIGRFGKGRAVAALAFRTIEETVYLTSAILVLSLVTLSRDYRTASFADRARDRVLGDTVLTAYRALGNVALLLAFSVGGLLYYLVFYQARLVPRWLSAWGMIGAVALLVAGVLVTLDVIAAESTAQFVLAAPIGIQEMVLAVWLITRGFSVHTGRYPVGTTLAGLRETAERPLAGAD